MSTTKATALTARTATTTLPGETAPATAAAASPSTLTELARLAWRRPRPGSSSAVVAAWYEDKAALHERLAAEAEDELSRARELAHAAEAAEHAHRLWTGVAA